MAIAAAFHDAKHLEQRLRELFAKKADPSQTEFASAPGDGEFVREWWKRSGDNEA